MWKVKVYLTWNTSHSFTVAGEKTAKEYAKRIGTEGLWYDDDEVGGKVFVPVHSVVKIRIYPVR